MAVLASSDRGNIRAFCHGKPPWVNVVLCQSEWVGRPRGWASLTSPRTASPRHSLMPPLPTILAFIGGVLAAAISERAACKECFVIISSPADPLRRMADDELNWFLYWFAPRVSFDVTRGAFTLHANNASITIPTYLYVRKTTGGHEIVSVGEDPAALNDAYRVDLFGGHEPPIDTFFPADMPTSGGLFDRSSWSAESIDSQTPLAVTSAA